MRFLEFELTGNGVYEINRVVVVSKTIIEGSLYPDILLPNPFFMPAVCIGKQGAPIGLVAIAGNGSRVGCLANLHGTLVGIS